MALTTGQVIDDLWRAYSHIFSTRVYCGAAPETIALPYVVWEPSGMDFEGHFEGEADITRQTIDMHLLGHDQGALLEASRDFENRYDRTAGSLASTDWYQIYCLDRQMDTLPPVDGSGTPIYDVILTVDLWRTRED